jgi:hypothetical protein
LTNRNIIGCWGLDVVVQRRELDSVELSSIEDSQVEPISLVFDTGRDNVAIRRAGSPDLRGRDGRGGRCHDGGRCGEEGYGSNVHVDGISE